MAEMGQRMLRGERMMAEACPNCPVPLMASDRGCVCCQCHTVWLQDEEGVMHGTDISVEFTNGQPTELVAILVLRNPDEWERFMRFMHACPKGTQNHTNR